MSSDLENRVDELFAWTEEMQKHLSDDREANRKEWIKCLKEFESKTSEIVEDMAAERKAYFRDGMAWAVVAGLFCGVVVLAFIYFVLMRV